MGTRRNGPKQTLSGHVATIKRLREMSLQERERNTCGTCQITYTERRYAQECRAWHQGG